MQITKDSANNDAWTPQYWLASGYLQIDLDGLGIDSKAEIEAAYYRAGTDKNTAPAWTPEPLPSSNSASSKTTDDDADNPETDGATSASSNEPDPFSVDTMFAKG